MALGYQRVDTNGARKLTLALSVVIETPRLQTLSARFRRSILVLLTDPVDPKTYSDDRA